jgi:hypothetical protein
MSTQTKEISFQGSEETRLRSLARDLAMDILPRDEILRHYGVDHEEWSRIAELPAFGLMYRDAVATWSSPMNTRERIETKTLTLVEMSLEEMFARLHDPKELLSSKVSLFVALQKGAGIGTREPVQLAEGSRVSITINMGDDREVKAEREPVTIEAIPLDPQE